MEKGLGVNSNTTVKWEQILALHYIIKWWKMFDFSKSKRSEKTALMVKWITEIKREKILPMYQSALTKLISDFKKNH